MKNLLLTGCFSYTEEQLAKIRTLGYHIYFMQQEADGLPVAASDIDAIVCNGLFLSHPIEEFTRLRFIQLTSAGLDRVPLDEIRKRQIKLCNARGVYNIPMAEWVIGQVLRLYKATDSFIIAQKERKWEKKRDLREIDGTKVAIVGAGSVGSEVAKRFHAFGAEVTGFDVHTLPTEGFDRMFLIHRLPELIGQFDVLVLTAPLTEQTFHLMGRELLCQMKHRALLVNIARGALIDEKALGDVLGEREDLNAVLDVFETEPLPADSPLWKLPNAILSPHNSFVSGGNNRRMFAVIYENLKSFVTL